MDTQLVSELMSQLNNQTQSTNNSLVDTDLVGNEVSNKMVSKRVSISPGSTSNPNLNVGQKVTVPGPNNAPNLAPNPRINTTQPNVSNQNYSLSQKNNSSKVFVKGPVPVPVPVPVKGINQIPKNLSNTSNVEVKSEVKSQVKSEVNIVDMSGDYYNIFGMQLSKTTIYCIIAFVAIIILYYVYKYFTSSSNKNKTKRKQEVSNVQQNDSLSKESKEDE